MSTLAGGCWQRPESDKDPLSWIMRLLLVIIVVVVIIAIVLK
jgi:hypothetical protein